ncbi:MAG: hypothetical protein COA97_12005 [Flavobacteriales bacterium]|nr:MAG: hypothetical protein COA97_12005 [Flavobacteriales bacterium]
MKPLCCAIIFLVISNISNGQVDSVKSKVVWGVNVGSLLSQASEGFNYYIYATAKISKSFFALGPVLGPKLKISRYNYSYSTNEQYKLNGFHFVYQINPNPVGKVFNFYFQYQFVYLYYRDEGVEYIGGYYNNGVSTLEPYKSHRIDIESFIGYGFNLKFSKNFYLSQSVGIGLTYESTSVDMENPDLIDDNDGYFGPSLMLNASLGYKFISKK